MGFFSFLRRRLSDELRIPTSDPSGYMPSFWEDDYCQVEVVPVENMAFIKSQLEQIVDFSAKAKDGDGFREVFMRGPLSVLTSSKEVRTDYLEMALLSFKLLKANHIRYDAREILNCETSNTRAFGFPDFTIFFDRKDEFVKNIWINAKAGFSPEHFKIIQSALYNLGEECGLILIDWNSFELIDLVDRRQIEKYLAGYRI
jgi:hypothetical protein